MIDFFSTYFHTDIQESVTLCDMQTIGIEDGDLKGNPFGYNGNITYKQQKQKFVVSGSLHKYFNGKLLENNLVNSNDFNFIQINQSLDDLESEIDKNWEDSKLTQVEFGFNLILNKPVDAMIKSIKLLDKTPPNSAFNSKCRCSKFFQKKNYYWVKAYNKAKHIKSGNNIFRFEVKLYSKKLKELDINTVSDLKNKSTYRKLFDFLLKSLDKLTIVEKTIGISGISSKEELLLRSGISADYWKELKSSRSRTTVKRQFDEFNNIISKYNLDENKKLLSEAFVNKFNKLINTDKVTNSDIINRRLL